MRLLRYAANACLTFLQYRDGVESLFDIVSKRGLYNTNNNNVIDPTRKKIMEELQMQVGFTNAKRRLESPDNGPWIRNNPDFTCKFSFQCLVSRLKTKYH